MGSKHGRARGVLIASWRGARPARQRRDQHRRQRLAVSFLSGATAELGTTRAGRHERRREQLDLHGRQPTDRQRQPDRGPEDNGVLRADEGSRIRQ